MKIEEILRIKEAVKVAFYFFAIAVLWKICFFPEFTVNVKYVYPDLGYSYETTLVTPEPTSPVDYSNSAEVPPGYVVPPQQTTPVPLKK